MKEYLRCCSKMSPRNDSNLSLNGINILNDFTFNDLYPKNSLPQCCTIRKRKCSTQTVSLCMEKHLLPTSDSIMWKLNKNSKTYNLLEYFCHKLLFFVVGAFCWIFCSETGNCRPSDKICNLKR